MSPSKLSSDVRRQYAFCELCTVNTTTFDWFTSRPRIVTNGLTVERDDGPLRSLLRQASNAELPAPGTDGPRTSAAMTAAAASTTPGRATLNQPPGERLANQAD